MTHEGVLADAAHGFPVEARDQGEQVAEKLRAYTEVIYAVRATIDASGDIEPAAFRRFVNGLAISDRYPGITNVSYAYRVAAERRSGFEQRIRAAGAEVFAGLPPFAINPPGDRPEYMVLSLIEPLGDNRSALGLDIAADPVRNAAVEVARDSGMVATTPVMTLVRDAGKRPSSVLLRLAVYESGGVPATIDQRRRLLAGVAGVAIRLPTLMDAAMPKEARSRYRLRVLDNTNSHATTGITADSGERKDGNIGPGPDAPQSILFDSAPGPRARRSWPGRSRMQGPPP